MVPNPQPDIVRTSSSFLPSDGVNLGPSQIQLSPFHASMAKCGFDMFSHGGFHSYGRIPKTLDGLFMFISWKIF